MIRLRAGGRVLLMLGRVAVVSIWMLPLLWVVLTSFKPYTLVASPTPVFVFRPTLDNYVSALVEYKLLKTFLNSFVIAAATTLITMLVAMPTAYALSRFRFRGGRQFASWILSIRMLPPIAVVIPFYILFHRLGLLDSLLGMIIIDLTITVPFSVWVLYGFFVDVSRDVEEAAMLDGCGPLRIIFSMFLHLSRPGIIVTAMFSFVFVWNEFLFALILTDTRAVTAPVGISKLILPYQVLWGELSAAGIMVLMPLVVVVAFLHQYIVRGMTFGAVR